MKRTSHAARAIANAQMLAALDKREQKHAILGELHGVSFSSWHTKHYTKVILNKGREISQ
jgi:hypothetical protein